MSDTPSGEPGRQPRSAMRLLPWLLLPLILVPLVLAIVRTRRPATPVADTTASAPLQDSVPVYQDDSSQAIPAAHTRAHQPHPASSHADSAARHKEGLLKRVGGGNAPVTPEGQGALGGDGPTGMGRGGADTARPAVQAPAGAMGGDGPPGKR